MNQIGTDIRIYWLLRLQLYISLVTSWTDLSVVIIVKFLLDNFCDAWCAVDDHIYKFDVSM